MQHPSDGHLADWQLNDWLTYLEKLHPQEIDLGLERVAEVYQRLGKPRPGKQTISIAGTNGKGSVCAHLTALAAASGLSCGSYTSPHLLAYNERFRINGQLATDKNICLAFAQIETVRAEISLSYFEFSTLAGILLMAEQDLDIAVFEVGLGGRLDAVNILDADCAIITSIDLDHQQWLGNSRELIALEKAGILRSFTAEAGSHRQSIVIGDRQPPDSLLRVVLESQQSAAFLGSDFDWHQTEDGVEISLSYSASVEKIKLPTSPLPAPVQNDNLVVAFQALDFLIKPLLLDTAKLLAEFKRMPLRGRLEQIASQPDVFLDVAHNPAAAEVLATWLKHHMVQQGVPRTKVWAVVAMLADKDVLTVCQIIEPWVTSWHLAGLCGPRGQSAEELQKAISPGLQQPQRQYETVSLALEVVRELAAPHDLILVFGSFLTVEQAIRYWNE
ncbi:MAG: bifunctional folylpolyglutamate synthase/dihydrofolate synthase [Xanthomonadales bacterium]|nr:bifunctional folylpolyglutamate synthase/dihydrofolate synthase [Xanthomonadales bacterium]